MIDDYLRTLTPAEREALQRIRCIVQKLVPDAKEVISYGMPGFKINGHYVIGFAAFKNHLSIFPTSEPIAVLKDKLHGFTLAKGTIQFTLEHQIPEDIIKELVTQRLKTIAK